MTLLKCLKKTSDCIINQMKFNNTDSLSDLKNDFLKSNNKTEN
ncbi:hypothetical protein PABG_12032 [Paracoccidioides brasiliensis Pb03]|nr:hypothetical protein PABG_12032 [Paracoccidioides brasiliensis Pb03]